MDKYHMGGFRSEPAVGCECWEAIWSQGSACFLCRVKCYRAGWTKERATADNIQLVLKRRRSGS